MLPKTIIKTVKLLRFHVLGVKIWKPLQDELINVAEEILNGNLIFCALPRMKSSATCTM